MALVLTKPQKGVRPNITGALRLRPASASG